MPDLWMPGAIRMPSTRTNALNGNGFRLITWHTFEAAYSLTARRAMEILIGQGSEAFVFHPITGEWVQCQPMNTAARTLKSTDATPTNRFGSVHQQVEVVAYAAQPWTSDLTDAGRAGLARGLDFFRSWGIPDQWAWRDQPPPAYPGGSVRRRLPEQSGHAYHSGWPVNNHGDPGAILAPWLATGPAWTPGGPLESYPKLRQGDRGAAVRFLQAVFGIESDGVFGPVTHATVVAYQTRKGLDPDGVVGPATWAAILAGEPVEPPPPAPAPAPVVEPTPAPVGTPILGTPGGSVDAYQDRAYELGASPLFADEMLPALYRAAVRYSIDPDVMIGQSAHETGWGRFGRAATPEHHNTCGLKVRNPVGPDANPDDHARFTTWDEGATAHAQHLYAYMGRPLPEGETNIDPRWDWVYGKHTATTVEELSGKWAPSPTYGNLVASSAARFADLVEPEQPAPAPEPEPVPEPTPEPVDPLANILTEISATRAAVAALTFRLEQKGLI